MARIRIDDPFWSPKLHTLFSVTLDDTFDKLERDGAIENYENLAAGRLSVHKGAPWHDGLLLETIRGAADYIARGEDGAALIKRIDRLFTDPYFGEVLRVKGFIRDLQKNWYAVNCTWQNRSVVPADVRRGLLVIIGQDMKEDRLHEAFIART